MRVKASKYNSHSSYSVSTLFSERSRDGQADDVRKSISSCRSFALKTLSSVFPPMLPTDMPWGSNGKEEIPWPDDDLCWLDSESCAHEPQKIPRWAFQENIILTSNHTWKVIHHPCLSTTDTIKTTVVERRLPHERAPRTESTSGPFRREMEPKYVCFLTWDSLAALHTLLKVAS